MNINVFIWLVVTNKYMSFIFAKLPYSSCIFKKKIQTITSTVDFFYYLRYKH